jgi:hypothetical protein
MGGCNAQAVFNVIVRDLELDISQFDNATISVTGKIERFQDLVLITVTSSSQIVTQSKNISAQSSPSAEVPRQEPNATSASAEKDIENARSEYEQTSSAEGEAARLRYVTKLADIYYRFLKNYWATGDKSASYVNVVIAELRKHPAPKDANSKELSQLLVGKWQSPRRTYVFRANGKWGNEDGPVSGNWRIQGNQLNEDGMLRTIVLINSDYFIYADKGDVFFHARVRD